MENEIQELKTADRKGIKNFFENSIEKIRKFDKEMSDCTSFSFPAFPFDLAMKITYNISKFIMKMIFNISKFELFFSCFSISLSIFIYFLVIGSFFLHAYFGFATPFCRVICRIYYVPCSTK